ncbi:Alpha/Beta hydrolase protein [Podospora appendiculata]|uniref:Carboxypeptidase n=1 Tax=Podospora appendiculata TaxID=314037 RepID=A0AAE0XAK5_9PEZI|nr:Alpha/Beta hydrolase protein [Podospora appendiculata]
MVSSSFIGGLLLLPLANLAAAMFPPIPENLSAVVSSKFPGASISYKETHICETTPGVRSYSGYVNLPADPSVDRNYEMHTFFWFFEARNNHTSAPLALWLQGGPGAPSVVSALGENGPCLVANDSSSTVLNPWSWNDKVNMLYVDQPVKVGFSYDSLVNGTINEIASPFMVNVKDFSTTEVPVSNLTHVPGTFVSQNSSTTASTSSMAAIAMWQFMQVWMQEFPEYESTDKFSIWSESYGGHYGPIFAEFFERQNDLIAAGNIASPAVQLHIETVGVINGLFDVETQMSSYPDFAFNNTYGIQAINETEYHTAVAQTEACRALLRACQEASDGSDPEGKGNNTEVNKSCFDAFNSCSVMLWLPYKKSGRNVFDIASPELASFPPKWAAGYLNTRETQQALGVPLNFTGYSFIVNQAFNYTGDFVRGHALAKLGFLLDRGVNVALMYGDRDYQCNWLGGEKVSLAIQSAAVPSAQFRAAGYANIETNPTYSGGLVRQLGNLSFARVYNSGHSVPYYQPETAYRIFNRAMANKDIATGTHSSANYTSAGPLNAFTLDAATPPTRPGTFAEPRACYLWDIFETCDAAQTAVLRKGNGIVEDYVLTQLADHQSTQKKGVW